MHDRQHLQDLQVRFNSGEALKFLYFWGHQPAKGRVTSSCLSQWYASPFVVDGLR